MISNGKSKMLRTIAAVAWVVVGVAGSANATTTSIAVPNYSFESNVVADGVMTTGHSSFSYVYGPSSVMRVFNPTTAEFSGAGGDSVLTSPAAGSQCLINTSTAAGSDVVAIWGGGYGGPGLTTLEAHKRYTVTVATASPLNATVWDGYSTIMTDQTAGCGFGPPNGLNECYPPRWNYYNIRNTGTWVDMKGTIISDDYITGEPGNPQGLPAVGDHIGIMATICAGSCIDNVRFTVSSFEARYFSGAESTTWDQGTTAKWSTTSGGTYNQTWSTSADYYAIFEGTAATVNVSGTISAVDTLRFNTDGYTLAGGGAITLVGDGVIQDNGGTDTINATITGSVGLRKTGSGTLILGGANTFTGYVEIVGGTLQLANEYALQNATLDYSHRSNEPSYVNPGVISFGTLTAVTFGGLYGSRSKLGADE